MLTHQCMRMIMLVLAVAALTAACGGAEHAAGDPGASSPKTETTAAEEIEPVRDVAVAHRAIERVVRAVEACSGTTQGAYDGCDAESLAAADPEVADLAPSDAVPGPGALQLAFDGDVSYIVQTAIDPLEGDTTWFAEVRAAGEERQRLCGGAAFTVESTEAGTPTDACPDGTW